MWNMKQITNIRNISLDVCIYVSSLLFLIFSGWSRWCIRREGDKARRCSFHLKKNHQYHLYLLFFTPQLWYLSEGRISLLGISLPITDVAARAFSSSLISCSDIWQQHGINSSTWDMSCNRAKESHYRNVF